MHTTCTQNAHTQTINNMQHIEDNREQDTETNIPHTAQHTEQCTQLSYIQF